MLPTFAGVVKMAEANTFAVDILPEREEPTLFTAAELKLIAASFNTAVFSSDKFAEIHIGGTLIRVDSE